MLAPRFTTEEKYVIEYYRGLGKSRGYRDALWQEISHMLPAVIIAGLGTYNESLGMALIALALLIFFKLTEAIKGVRWGLVFGSIFAKYDDAFSQEDRESEAENST